MIIILFLLSISFSKDISEKLIISANKNHTIVQMDFLKLKMYFRDNNQMKVLQEIYKLSLEIETVGEYTMVVIKPIQSIAVKNELLVYLSSHFQDIFSLEENKRETTSPNNLKDSIDLNRPNSSADESIIHQAGVLVEAIGLQWITLFLLSVIGLTLSLGSRSKMENLEDTQKELRFKQEQIEEEIKKLGASGV